MSPSSRARAMLKLPPRSAQLHTRPRKIKCHSAGTGAPCYSTTDNDRVLRGNPQSPPRALRYSRARELNRLAVKEAPCQRHCDTPLRWRRGGTVEPSRTETVASGSRQAHQFSVMARDEEAA